MHRTIEAIVDADGTVRLLEPVGGGARRRALVTILDEAPDERAAVPIETLRGFLKGIDTTVYREADRV